MQEADEAAAVRLASIGLIGALSHHIGYPIVPYPITNHLYHIESYYTVSCGHPPGQPRRAMALLPRLEALVAAVAPPKKPKVRRLKPEELKELIAKRVEERGRLSLYDYARRYGQTRAVVREIAKSLAEERGWEIVQEPKRLILRKPAPREASAEAGE